MYLRQIMDTYFADPELDELNRHLFSIAAYDTGPTHGEGHIVRGSTAPL